EAGMLYQGSSGLDHVEVGFLEYHFLACPLPARLLAGLLRPADHDALAERIEAVGEDLTEAAAIGDQQGDRSNAPYNAQHGEQAAGNVALEGDPGFANDLSQHTQAEKRTTGGTKIDEGSRKKIPLRSFVSSVVRGFHPPASYLSASMGSIEAALRA